MKRSLICLAIFFGVIQYSYSQKTDTVKRYLTITAGMIINAYHDDKPLEIETISDFKSKD